MTCRPGWLDEVTDALAASRRRSTRLLAAVPDGVLVAQHSPIMSPLVWDLAHVAHYEGLWLVRALGGSLPPGLHPDDVDPDDVYDAFRHPRGERPSLRLLGPAEARAYAAAVRDRAGATLTAAAAAAAGDDPGPLLREGFVARMVVRHEHQHIETMLATLGLVEGWAHPDADGDDAPGRPAGCSEAAEVPEDPAEVPMVEIPAGPFVMGTDDDPWAYDNERPAQVVDLPAFRIDVHPVTNRAYAAFVADGGYRTRRWWSEDGWAWRRATGAAHPGTWRPGRRGWWRVRFGRLEPVPPAEPVQHVCWFEADAYLRWAGKRLPTEAEWEKAAAHDPARPDRPRRLPWGPDRPTPDRAVLAYDGAPFRPAPVGLRPAGASATGVCDLLGNTWEWTASEFGPYPGFRAFPYREYSEVFFGRGYRVLRGGSWATHPDAVSTTFRNWDLPERRQIFAGLRGAEEV
jgi:iron(II)-dependent oxidoreductase